LASRAGLDKHINISSHLWPKKITLQFCNCFEVAKVSKSNMCLGNQGEAEICQIWDN
jgi:hypothetical protein